MTVATGERVDDEEKRCHELMRRGMRAGCFNRSKVMPTLNMGSCPSAPRTNALSCFQGDQSSGGNVHPKTERS